MNDSPVLQGSHLAARGTHLRSTSDSPMRQRPTDDLLANLSPRMAVDAFQNPSGPLKADMDAATPAERAFALRTAVASKKIQEWMDELLAWPWPSGGGPAGFEMPTTKRRKMCRSEGSPLNTAQTTTDDASFQKIYMGSLLASEVAHYQSRVDEIAQGLEELNIEEIKSRVLHQHIMPLSSPSSPMSDNRSAMSWSSYVRMNDLTALITAITVQALLLLSKLTRLMNIWSTRLLVLRKTTTFLSSLADAEAALQSGWNTLSRGSRSESKAAGSHLKEQLTTLSWEEFHVMKSVIGKIVSGTGRELDSMLDALEGYPDTLPEPWIDRMETLQEKYAEWVAVCERKIREAEWAAAVRERQQTQNKQVQLHSAEKSDGKQDAETLCPCVPQVDTGVSSPAERVSTPTESKPVERGTPVIKIHSAVDDPNAHGVVTVHDNEGRRAEVSVDQSESAVQDECQQAPGRFDGSIAEINQPQQSRRGQEKRALNNCRGRRDSDSDDPWEVVEAESESEPELPILPRPRLGSGISMSTVLRGQPNRFEDLSSDAVDHGTPELPRLRGPVVQPESLDGSSPPSSPPQSAFRTSTRSFSVSFLDMPTVREVPDESTPPRTLPDSSLVMDGDISRDIESPGKTSVTTADDQLQQQISEILESVPAKIRLTSEPQPINLNPPDFVMPTSRPSKPDPIPRSQSSLSVASSRAGTPSFMLAPARSRSRQQRGNQDIKLYHLSRSNGEAPIKLFIRCVGENGERVMVRVGGGWADLGEYLKEYASHHSRRSVNGKEGKVEIKDLPASARMAMGSLGSSPPNRPASALETRSHTGSSPITPLNVRKTRKTGADDSSVSAAGGSAKPANTPLTTASKPETPPSGTSTRSRSSSHLSWVEEDSSLGMAGPRTKNIEMSDESRAWIDSVKEKVRIASGEQRTPNTATTPASNSNSISRCPDPTGNGKFGDMGKVGGTKRLFRKQV